MNNLNSILLEGNLIENPYFSVTERGNSLCRFTILSKRFVKMDDEYQEED